MESPVSAFVAKALPRPSAALPPLIAWREDGANNKFGKQRELALAAKSALPQPFACALAAMRHGW
jgi:hypothetical protein